MTKAIIFDFFKVLTVKGSLEPLRQFDPTRTYEKQFKELVAQHDLGKDLDWLCTEMSKLHGIPAEELKAAVENQPQIAKNQPLLNFIKTDLKPKYKISLLSNVGPLGLMNILSVSDWTLFDDRVLSYEVGLAKPDPAIYRLAATRLNLQPEECIFVDDREENIQAAKSIGMQTVLYVAFDDFAKVIDQILSKDTVA